MNARLRMLRAVRSAQPVFQPAHLIAAGARGAHEKGPARRAGPRAVAPWRNVDLAVAAAAVAFLAAAATIAVLAIAAALVAVAAAHLLAAAALLARFLAVAALVLAIAAFLTIAATILVLVGGHCGSSMCRPECRQRDDARAAINHA